MRGSQNLFDKKMHSKNACFASSKIERKWKEYTKKSFLWNDTVAMNWPTRDWGVSTVSNSESFFLHYFGSPFSVTETNFPSWTRIPSQRERERERGVVLGTDRERKDVGGERESNGVKAKSFVKGLKLVMCISYN